MVLRLYVHSARLYRYSPTRDGPFRVFIRDFATCYLVILLGFGPFFRIAHLASRHDTAHPSRRSRVPSQRQRATGRVISPAPRIPRPANRTPTPNGNAGTRAGGARRSLRSRTGAHPLSRGPGRERQGKPGRNAPRKWEELLLYPQNNQVTAGPPWHSCRLVGSALIRTRYTVRQPTPGGGARHSPFYGIPIFRVLRCLRTRDSLAAPEPRHSM